MKNIQVKNMILAALGICLVFAATSIIKIPNGLQGYFNCGDGVILAFATLVNPIYAFCIGGIGSALADIAGGYASYALFTLLIKGLEGVIVAYLYHKHANSFFTFAIAVLWMIAGYVIADVFVNQSIILGLAAIPSNILQGIVGILLGKMLVPIIHSAYKEA